MTKLILLVDDVLPDGKIITPVHRLRDVSPNFQPNIFDRTVDCYLKYCGDKVKFMPLREFNGAEPGVKYVYFVPINDWHWNFQQFYFMVDKQKLKLFADNGVAFYFCQDIEMYPNVNFKFFADYLGMVKLFQMAHAYPDIPVRFGMCATLSPEQENALHTHFSGWLKLIHSPIMMPYSRDGVIEKYAAKGTTVDVDQVFSDYMNTEKEREYMCLNRDPKFSRILFLHALRAYNLLDDGYVSNLLPKHYSVDFNSQSEFISMLDRDMKNGPIPYLEADKLEATDVVNALVHNGTAGVLPLDHMAKSYYDIVQETTTRYDAKGVVDQGVVTEKLVKSLMVGRPFMVNGGPRVLEVVRKMGFKTCSYLFDESYDTSLSLVERHRIIVENIKRWNKKPQELKRVIEQNVDSLQHNIKHMKDFPLEDKLIEALDL